MRYIIKNSDLLHNGEKFPEGSEIELSEKEAKKLAPYLEKAEKTKEEKEVKK